jgi:D-threo-aldose 1-dehydrogenase
MQAPRLGFGGAPIGNLFASVEGDAAIGLVRSAFDRGIRYFDTAPHYGNGLSERRISAGLRGIDRDEYVLSSKVGRILVADADAPRDQNSYVDVLPFRQRWDYSRDGTLRSIDDSLTRLNTSRHGRSTIFAPMSTTSWRASVPSASCGEATGRW